jgi:ParB family chromosome partitioning protein
LESGKPGEKSRLGRGLASLIPSVIRDSPAVPTAAVSGDVVTEVVSENERLPVLRLKVSEIVPNTLQPRVSFNQEALQELADSIAAHGVLQPVLVRPVSKDRYELIAGERRFRAAQLAGLTDVPVIVRETTDSDALAIALIENIQREDLNPIETACAYRQLMDQFDLTQSELARQVGKAQPSIANAVQLLKLSSEIQESIRSGRLSEEHGKALLAVSDETKRRGLWLSILAQRLTVAETRKKAQVIEASAFSSSQAVKAGLAGPGKDVHWQALEDRLRGAVGMRVGIKPARNGRGSIIIDFASEEELEGLLDRLEH